MFRYFENLVAPYPDAAPAVLPRGFFAFLWACARGARRYIAAMTLLTAVIGVFEALLFSILGCVVDWLAKVEPARLWTEHAGALRGAVTLGLCRHSRSNRRRHHISGPIRRPLGGGGRTGRTHRTRSGHRADDVNVSKLTHERQRWSRFPEQNGGLAKMDSGLDYAANFSSFAWVA